MALTNSQYDQIMRAYEAKQRTARLEQEKKKVYEEIKGDIAQISVSIAEKVVGREISVSDHEALISKFIENVGEDK